VAASVSGFPAHATSTCPLIRSISMERSSRCIKFRPLEFCGAQIICPERGSEEISSENRIHGDRKSIQPGRRRCQERCLSASPGRARPTPSPSSKHTAYCSSTSSLSPQQFPIWSHGICPQQRHSSPVHCAKQRKFLSSWLILTMNVRPLSCS